MSSRRLCSMPRCVLMLAYRAVPVRFLFSLEDVQKGALAVRSENMSRFLSCLVESHMPQVVSLVSWWALL